MEKKNKAAINAVNSVNEAKQAVNNFLSNNGRNRQG